MENRIILHRTVIKIQHIFPSSHTHQKKKEREINISLLVTVGSLDN